MSPGSTAADPPRAGSPAGNRADVPAAPAPDANAGQDSAGSAAPAAEAPPAAAVPRVLACTERMPSEHAGCAMFYMFRSADGPVQPLKVPELAAAVDCGLLPQGPTLASLEQVRLCLCMPPPT